MQIDIKKFIIDFVTQYQQREEIRSRWEEPLVAFANADDPRFGELKKAVSPSHALPQDLLPDAKSVITYFLPFNKSVTQSNVQGEASSEQWALAYIETNRLISSINKHINEVCAKSGYQSSIIPATHNFDEERLISDWSHRHVAYIAGLGKFGLNRMLITAKGSAGRIGSIVTNLEIEPTQVEEWEYCLYKINGTCKKCVKRCVGGALKVDSFDRKRCYEILLSNDKRFPDLGLADVCGKCVVGLPCTFTNPSKRLKC